MRVMTSTLLVAALAGVVLPAYAAAPQRQRPAGATYSAADAEDVTRRLYKGILGREADPDGLRANAAGVRRGSLESVVRGLLGSDEFLGGTGTKSARQILNTFYSGLLGRDPDSAGISAFMPRIERRQYLEVVMEIVNSNEFQDSLGTAGNRSGTVTGTPAVSALDSALACQGQVITAVSRDAGGRIFLTFDRLPQVSADGRDVSGPAVDRFMNKDRQLSYRCLNSNVTYSYGDRRPAVAYNDQQFPSGAVRACQQAVRAGLLFDAASLSASDTNTEYVLGLSGGRVYRCAMDRTRVVSVK
jgi:hypothetical protein